VHAWLDWDNVRAGLAAVLAGVPKIVLSGRNLNPSHFSLYQSYMDPAYRALVQVPSVKLINNSRAGGNDYADWLGIPRTRVEVVYNGVDFGTQERLPADAAQELRTSLGIPADAFLVGGVFRLEEEKRPLLWIETAALVAREIADAWFLVFGQGSMRQQMLRRAKEMGLQNRLIMLGVSSQILRMMSIMDLLFLTSRVEGLPNVLLEAQWVGTPVVTTHAGGAKEAIDKGVSGWAIASDQPIELARQIVFLCQHPTVLAEARRHGPMFVRKQFGVARMICQTMKMYGYAV
jgi:glycosyltransferase involved in cell wall biosynthesis